MGGLVGLDDESQARDTFSMDDLEASQADMDEMQHVLDLYRQRIKLLRLLNRGGQGHVYKAMSGGSEVAVKVYFAQTGNVEAEMEADGDDEVPDGAGAGGAWLMGSMEQTDFDRQSAAQELRAYERLRLEGIQSRRHVLQTFPPVQVDQFTLLLMELCDVDLF